MMRKNTRFKSGVSGNAAAKWKPGQSGNPAGKSKRRTLFEDAFNEALITEGSPEEAAKLLWESARAKEPWAIQEVCRRFSPVTESLHLTHEVENERFDLSRLTIEEGGYLLDSGSPYRLWSSLVAASATAEHLIIDV
jgi:hypothetical protein